MSKSPIRNIVDNGGLDRSAVVSGISYFVGMMAVGIAIPRFSLLARPLEAAVLAAGLAFFFVSVVIIQRHMDLSIKATGFGEPQKLVRTWVFARSRNPIYVAFLVPLAALAVLSLWAASIAIAIYVWLMNRCVISREERDLERLFGQDFLDYKAATPRWLF